MTAIGPSRTSTVEPGVYQSNDGYILVTEVACLEGTGEYVIVFKDGHMSVACSEDEFLRKGLILVKRVVRHEMTADMIMASPTTEKRPKQPLSWLWHHK